MQVSGSTPRGLGALGVLVAVSALLLVVVAPSAYAHPVDDNATVLPANSRVSGKTLGEWSAAWWQYVFSIPADDNPLLDPSGARCGEEQSGKVFFLVGTISGSATRNNCTVPEGRMLFFPLINLEDNAAEEAVSPIVDPPPTARKMASLLNCLVAGGSTPFAPAFKTCQGVTELHATIDGVALHHLFAFRATSPTFRIRVPSGSNLEGAFVSQVSRAPYSQSWMSPTTSM